MDSNIVIAFIAKSDQKSEYDWANISYNNERVGKARCKISGNKLIIYSINVFPEFEGHGFGKAFVERAKEHYDEIVADRVRSTAIGFWEKVGFVKKNESEWVYNKS